MTAPSLETLYPELSDKQFVEAAVSSLLSRSVCAGEWQHMQALVEAGGREGFVNAILACDEFKAKFLANPLIAKSLASAVSAEAPLVSVERPFHAEICPVPIVLLGQIYHVYDFPPHQALKWICSELNDDEYGLFDLDLRSEGTIVDIGAHVGLFALAAKARWPAARVVSFEPFPATFALLQENVRINQITGIELYNAGVSGDGRRVELAAHLTQNSGATSSWSTVSYGARTLAGETMTFTDAMNSAQVQEIDLLKVDCEGFEHEILNDRFPYERVRNLSVEIHQSERLERRGHTAGGLISLLSDRIDPTRLRYKVVDI